jgi:hypothetical protein
VRSRGLTSRRLEARNCWYPVANHADARGVRAGGSQQVEVNCWRVVVSRMMVMGGGGGSCRDGRPRHGLNVLPFDSKLDRVLMRGLNN